MSENEEYKINWGTAIFRLLLIFGVLMVFFAVVAAGIWGYGVVTANIFGRGEAHKQIQSAEYRITAYDHFFNLCAAVQSDEYSLDAQFVQILTAETEKDRARVNANIAGLQANRQRGIAQYNADAMKSYTEGQFRDSDLPFQISPVVYPEGGKTQCAVGY